MSFVGIKEIRMGDAHDAECMIIAKVNELNLKQVGPFKFYLELSYA